jgi:hypothetical protein
MANPGKDGTGHVNFLTLMKKMRQPVIPSDEARDSHATYDPGQEIAGQDGGALPRLRGRGEQRESAGHVLIAVCALSGHRTR